MEGSVPSGQFFYKFPCDEVRSVCSAVLQEVWAAGKNMSILPMIYHPHAGSIIRTVIWSVLFLQCIKFTFCPLVPAAVSLRSRRQPTGTRCSTVKFCGFPSCLHQCSAPHTFQLLHMEQETGFTYLLSSLRLLLIKLTERKAHCDGIKRSCEMSRRR